MLILIVHPETGDVFQKDETEVSQEELTDVDESTADIFKFDGNSYWRAAVNDNGSGGFKIEWKPL